MKMRFTSNELTNATIVDALAQLMGIPFGKTKVAFVPMAANVEEGDKSWL